MSERTIALLLFVAAYVLFVLLPHRRSIVAVCTSVVLIALGTVSLGQAVYSINWNVMGIFVGMLIVADAFIESRFPAYLAEIIVNRSKSTAWAMLFICALTSVISIFVENVATVLIVGPIAMSLAKKLNINPVSMMIGIAISSNLQGAATLIGDPPSMLLGGFAKMNFADFFVYRGRPSIFFAVELGAIVSMAVLYWVFRRHTENPTLMAVEKVKSWWPTILLVGLIAALAASSFIDTGFSHTAGILCMAFGGFSLLWERFSNQGTVWGCIKRLDWDTTFFLVGIFVIVGSLTETGWIQIMADGLSQVIGANIFLGFAALVLLSIVVSAFVDNVPYLAAMLPVALSMSNDLHRDPSLFLFGLLIGASLGGNVTPIGASANIVACGMLKKEGHIVTFGQFARISVPFTIASVVPAAAFVWFVWS